MKKTLFDKIWDAHWVGQREDGRQLLYIDRHIVHELHAPHAFADMDKHSHEVRRKDITVVVQDHTVPTRVGVVLRSAHIDATALATAKHGVKRLSVEDPRHGISHVISPEQGWAVPGGTLACPDSHSSTVGALGCLAFGCGTTEMVHVLATQTIAMEKPLQMRVNLAGRLGFGVTAKDVALHLIRTVGVDFGRGHAVEYAGPVVSAMDLESRMTLCNMTIEWSGRTCLIAPDQRTFDWISQQAHSPKGAQWHEAVQKWQTFHSDADAVFDTEVTIDCASIGPQITWGTDPSQSVNVDEPIGLAANDQAQAAARQQSALSYMDLQAGQTLMGLPIHRVFIGSCTNARITDLRHAASVIQGRKVAPGVTALVVPGSNAVKRQAEAEGLDQIFLAAGFEWHLSGCSMCAGANGEVGRAGERCVATSNRNFENRQGRGVRTHLASPAMAAAAAVAGHIVDFRPWLQTGATS